MEKSRFTFTTENKVEAIKKIVRLITDDKIISVNSRRITTPQKNENLYTGTTEYTIVSYKEDQQKN
ncbi:hypothetical protein [Bacillus atrophaeus]|uniref:hypothetical protein n=1 Tax=Bacillus atrophaeus TaxID=1452 RepID=UPI00077A452C|nr:hypothetical protein [Bacillus atrophaeus]KXZ13301.1 hypothetical protein AXI57_16225 [Bacillus atrophaeus]MED4806288.1 hypothetical protein [Bacillus atrophaeus]UFD97595.1 hypothetical protein [Bacillus atrophaeus]GED04295.1 hypothetical protein BAT02nite_39390 [Bacillus atrophaeus]